MTNREIAVRGILNAIVAAAYVAVIAIVLSYGNRIFGIGMVFLVPMAILLLFVISAAVMGLLIFGRPVMMYIDGKKCEAVRLVGWTVGSLAAVTVIVLAVLAMINAR